MVISGVRMVLEMRRSYQRVFQGKETKLQLNVIDLFDADEGRRDVEDLVGVDHVVVA